ncbi:hypothetical protein PHET_07014 [Paragonimus heterotremus]|uniref:Fibronectin type-III domain-containing protein n=1 Tax=Paragonimus heterotremus TaxID=100268 RepID=A0A8J4WXI4_9TREM|nr:hypothetical protein PHET_07014 [Paragonimus heterotremus]
MELSVQQTDDHLFVTWTDQTWTTGETVYQLIQYTVSTSAEYVIEGYNKYINLSVTPCSTVGLLLRVNDTNGIPHISKPTMVKISAPVPSAPTELVVENSVPISGQLVRWNRPEVASYECSLRYELLSWDDSNSTNEKSVVLNETNYEAKLLAWNTRYFYQVRALAGEEQIPGPYSEIISLSTGEIPNVDVSFLDIEATNQSILVTWALPRRGDNGVTGYRITYIDRQKEVTARVPDYQTWYRIAPLNACSHYTVLLTSYAYATVTSPATKMIQTKPTTAPTRTVIVETNSTCGTIYLRWEPADSNEYVTAYSVQAKLVSDRFQMTTGTIMNNIMIQDLICDEQYTVTVSARNACGESLGSTPVNLYAADQAPAAEPTAFVAVSSTTSINVTWTDTQPTRVGLSYLVTLDELQSVASDPLHIEQTTYSEKELVFDRLPSCTEFETTVTAINHFGKSATIRRFIGTSAPVPGVPTTFQVNRINETSYNLTWDHVQSSSSRCNVSYRICATDLTQVWSCIQQTTEDYMVVTDLMENQVYVFKVKALAGWPHVEGDFSEEVRIRSKRSSTLTLESPWSYVIILVLMCTITVTALIGLIFGRRFIPPISQPITEVESKFSAAVNETTKVDNVMMNHINTLPNSTHVAGTHD